MNLLNTIALATAFAPVQPKVPLRAEPFRLTQVRLLDGPYKHAQELDHKYLLSLDPDRLLFSFRANAKLPKRANVKPYGGWEAPSVELRGHFVGHYLSACSLMYASMSCRARCVDIAAVMLAASIRIARDIGRLPAS